MSSNKRGRQKEFQQTAAYCHCSCHEWGRGCAPTAPILDASSCCKTQMCLALSFRLRVNHILSCSFFIKKKYLTRENYALEIDAYISFWLVTVERFEFWGTRPGLKKTDPTQPYKEAIATYVNVISTFTFKVIMCSMCI